MGRGQVLRLPDKERRPQQRTAFTDGVGRNAPPKGET